VRFSVAATGPCRLAVFDACGRLVWQQGVTAASGTSLVTWNRVDARGRAVPAGVYLARLESAAGSSTVKVVLK
jgi:hypothetical protein